MITSKHMFRGAILLWMVCATNGCGSHPTPMNTPRDIQRAPNNTERIRIGLLAIDYYPLLSKFNRLRDADFFTLAGTGANNEKLLAFSKLKLDNLEGISLLNCPAVTDVGIHHLSAIESLRHIQLEGTGITDKAIDVIVSDMQLTGINVANCSNVTFQGLRKLASYEPLLEFGFSADNLKQKEVELLISELRSVKWLIIVDSKGNLKVPDLELAAKGKNISLNVSRTGALQDVKN